MLKIGNLTTTATADGEFSEGNAQAGVSPTLIKGEWLNVIQRELIAVLAAANITPAVGNNAQVAEAILKMAQYGPGSYALDTGAANVYRVAYSPAVTQITDGMILRFKAKTSSTGPSTFSPNGLTAIPIVGPAHYALSGSEITGNGDVCLQYNSAVGGGCWVLLDATGGPLQVSPGTALSHAASLLQVQADSARYALDTGAANIYTAAYSPAVVSLTDGLTLKFKAKVSNSGASTFSPNGLAAKQIYGGAHAPLQGGEIVAGGDVWLQYNTTSGGWILVASTGGALQVPNATQSQHAMPLSQATGRVLNVQIITSSGTITKTPGAKTWIVEGGGGGGQGGGAQATAASQVAAGGGGSSGATAKAVFDVSSISSATAVIGDAGSGAASGAAGNAGGTTTLTMGSSSLTLPGGPGGSAGAASASLPNDGGSAAQYSSAPTHVGALSFQGTQGGGATTALLLSLAAAQAGIGGSSVYGSSRQSGNAVGYCSGGPGARSLVSASAVSGANGSKGILIIIELS